MATATESEQLKVEWLRQLTELIAIVEAWASESGWATRRIEISLQDSQLGKYKAPALLLQEDAIKIILEPVSRSAPGVDGVVDLYLMPAYDDIASLYLNNGNWNLHYMFPDSPTVATMDDAESKPLSKESLSEVLEAMKKNAA